MFGKAQFIWVSNLAARVAGCKPVTFETSLVRVQPGPPPLLRKGHIARNRTYEIAETQARGVDTLTIKMNTIRCEYRRGKEDLKSSLG